MIGFATERPEGAGDRRGALREERARLAQRNRATAIAPLTCAAAVDLRTRGCARGNYFLSFLEPWRMANNALTALIQGLYIQGISGREPPQDA